MPVLPDGARHIDPAAEAERLGCERRAPADCSVQIADEYHLVGNNEMASFVHITLRADRPFPVSADLGCRIADLIRDDLRGEGG